MLKSKYGRNGVGLAAVLAVALIGAMTVGLWAGTVGPASTDAELVEPAAIDLGPGVFLGDPVADVDPAAAVNASAPCPCDGTPCPCPPCAHRVLINNDCNACCWTCGVGEPFCWAG